MVALTMSNWTEADIPDLTGKTIVVTGANSGIGYEAARALAQKNASVVTGCRNPEKGGAAIEAIRKVKPDARVELAQLDLASLASVRSFAERVAKQHPRIDVLINNAGIMAVPWRATEDGFESQMGTNHLGHFALTGLLLGRLVEGGHSRVVSVSSAVHTMAKFGSLDAEDLRFEHGYSKWVAYGRSKMANLLFTYELERRLERHKLAVAAVACHPGYAATNLQSVGPEMSGSVIEKAIMSFGNAVFAQHQRDGALPTLYAATSPDVRGGDFVGPSKMRNMFGAPKKQRSNRMSHDETLAKKLWDTSVQLTGVNFGPLAS